MDSLAQPECSRGVGGPPCGRCAWCYETALLITRPRENPKEWEVLRALAAIKPSARWRFGVYDGEDLHSGWRGYAVEVVTIDPRELPLSAHPAWIWDLPNEPEPRAVIRWRFWRRGQDGHLDVIWDRRNGAQLTLRGFDPDRLAGVKDLVQPARAARRRGAPPGGGALAHYTPGRLRAEYAELAEERRGVRLRPPTQYDMAAWLNVARTTLYRFLADNGMPWPPC